MSPIVHSPQFFSHFFFYKCYCDNAALTSKGVRESLLWSQSWAAAAQEHSFKLFHISTFQHETSFRKVFLVIEQRKFINQGTFQIQWRNGRRPQTQCGGRTGPLLGGEYFPNIYLISLSGCSVFSSALSAIDRMLIRSNTELSKDWLWRLSETNWF